MLLALHAGQPVYLAGLLGGAAEALGRVLLEELDPFALWQDLQLEDLYRQHAEPSASGLADGDLDLGALSEYLASPAAHDRLLANGLSDVENLRLLDSSLEEEAVELVVRGLHAVAARSRGVAAGGAASVGV